MQYGPQPVMSYADFLRLRGQGNVLPPTMSYEDFLRLQALGPPPTAPAPLPSPAAPAPQVPWPIGPSVMPPSMPQSAMFDPSIMPPSRAYSPPASWPPSLPMPLGLDPRIMFNNNLVQASPLANNRVASNPALTAPSTLTAGQFAMPSTGRVGGTVRLGNQATGARGAAATSPPASGGWGASNPILARALNNPLRGQQADEPWGEYQMRAFLSSPFRALQWAGDNLNQLATGVTETPAHAETRRTQAQTRPGGVGGPQNLASAFGVAAPSAGGGGGGFNVQGFFTALERSGATAVSPAGARGSMQLMEPTGAGTARQHGIPWDRNLYLNNDAYRSQIATLHGQDLLQTWGHPVLAAVAYNAGEPRLRQWLQRYGDPRTGQVNLQDWINRIPIQETRNYAARALQMTGPAGANGMPIPPMAFDESGYREAMGMNNQAAQLMQQPVEQSWNPGPMPELPAPTPIQPTDFTQVDKRLAAARPEGDTPQEQRRMQRRGWLAGIARGLASVDLSATGGAGVGQLFAAVGAGALSGRAAADEEIQRREDLHDQQMREYELLMANHETRRAEDVAQTMRYNSQQAYDHSLRQFNLRYQDWETQARPQISGGRIFTTRVNAETGERTVRSAPIDNSALAGAMMANAQIAQTIAAGRNQVGQANWQFNAAQLMTQAAQTGEPQDMATAIAVRVGEALQSGVVNSVMSPEDMQQFSQAAWESAMTQVPLSITGAAADAQRQQIMQTQLIAGVTARAMQDPALRAALMGGSGTLGSAASAAQRYMGRDESTRTSRNRTGLPTVTSTVRQ